jgi:hypothetical protein
MSSVMSLLGVASPASVVRRPSPIFTATAPLSQAQGAGGRPDVRGAGAFGP